MRTDEGRTAFVPNSQMVTSTVVNRSLEDRRRRISVRLPIGITRSVEEARRVLLQTAAGIGTSHLEDASVLVDDVGERVTWLVVTGYRPRAPRSSASPPSCASTGSPRSRARPAAR